jgi:hypothetical protein
LNPLIHKSITAILWAVVGSAFLGSFLFFGSRVAMLVVSFGMLCDSCNSGADLLQALGALPLGIIILIGAMVLIVWHVDRWPYKAAAPAILVVAMALAPADVRHHWFWWLAG